ncbi:hypothetical protein M0R45_032433 [Rubus argutus]|uniref:Syntaxin N-terminal domain-containing protein n=1 Tax=Rubus argutus TaxID=59490 RepID=A0AAW1WKD4_RUBAR
MNDLFLNNLFRRYNDLEHQIYIDEVRSEVWDETVNLDGFFKQIENVKVIKGKLEALELSNADQRKLPECGPGSSSDRTRTSVLNGLAKKLKAMMDDFQGLKANKEMIENLIASGEGETLVQEQGRGQILDTMQEIQERRDAVKEIEKSLIELHQASVPGHGCIG